MRECLDIFQFDQYVHEQAERPVFIIGQGFAGSQSIRSGCCLPSSCHVRFMTVRSVSRAISSVMDIGLTFALCPRNANVQGITDGIVDSVGLFLRLIGSEQNASIRRGFAWAFAMLNQFADLLASTRRTLTIYSLGIDSSILVSD